MTSLDYSKLTKKKPEKSLIKSVKYRAGRDNRGHISVRHKGGRVKRLYRLIDFNRDKRDIAGRVAAIEYDPNRTSNIALIIYADGEKRYIICPAGLKVNDQVLASENAPLNVGNALPLKKIPVGTQVHNVELVPGQGGKIIRSAGSFALIKGLKKDYVHLKLASGELRRIAKDCYATIGSIDNRDWKNIVFGKAGRKRYLGIRPAVRGVAMHPGAHPHGGGEGRSGIGMPSPKSPWGKKTLGKRTRSKKKTSGKYIIERRK